MSQTKNTVTTISVLIAIVAVAWAVYASRHSGSAASPPGGGMPPAAAGGRGGPAALLPIPVVSAVVTRESLSRELKALGTARANEAIDLTAKTTNIVTAIRFKDGDRVAAGAVLVELDGAQVKAELAAAEAALTESLAQYRRARELLPTQALSQSQFDQIEALKNANAARVEAARARFADTVIRAPFAGRVGLRRISVGTLITPGTVITTLDDLSIIKVDFPITENQLTALRAGLGVTATAASFPGRRFAGRVSSVDSRIDASSRSVLVRAEFDNRDNSLKPGMLLNIELMRDELEAIVVQEEALVPEDKRQFVYVVKDGIAEKREVSIGARRPGKVQVTRGLEAGERVVVEGTIRLRESSPVRDLAVEART